MKPIFVYAIALCSPFLLTDCSGGKVYVDKMLCEYSEHPISVDSHAPRFVWSYDGDVFEQGKYVIQVSKSKSDIENESPDLYVKEGESSEQFFVYDGDLSSHTKYYWRVKAYSKNGMLSAISPIDSFVTAKMSQSDWKAVWISDNKDKECASAPMLRKSFEVKDIPVANAYLYLSAAAYCDMNINGKSANEAYLNPGYTHYDKRNLYSVDDVTKLLMPGKNVMTAVLGNGFYNEIDKVSVWDFETARWRNRARMLCELRIEYADGSTQTILSDDSWKTATGPYVSNNIYSGDFYDARLEIKGWENVDFDDSKWSNALAVEAPSPVLKAQNMPAIESEGLIDAVDMKKLADTLYVYNFGKNFSGLCELTVRGEKGTKLTLKHAEIQKPDGNIEPGNINIYFNPKKDMEFQTDVYVLSGDGEETFKPKFSYHGFQYVEVKSDKPIELKQSDLKAKFIHTAVRPVGKFRCSNDMLNKLGEATKTSYLSNLMSIPTDCPQREKNGWTADAHVSVDLGLMNFDGIRVYEKWMDDFVDNQTAEGRISGIIPSAGWGYADWIGPVWDAAMFIIPNAVYNYYGDTKCIEKIWPVAVNYLEYLKAREDENGTVTYGIGDWVFFKTPTPTDYTTTCYYYLDNSLMAKFADLLGKDGKQYGKKAEELKTLINTKYFDKDKALYSTGTQAAQAVALYLGLVPAEYEQKVADNLSEMIKANDGLLDFGMLGSKTVLRMLTKYGHAQQAYELATQTEAPSWGAWMERGLTSLPETWVLSPTFKDASLNHVFLGDVYAWMYNDLAGINYDPEKPGFANILIRPHFVDGLDWVDAEYDSVKGLIKSSWKKDGDKVTLTVTIPANCSAIVEVGDDIREISSGTHSLKYNTLH